MVTNGGEWWRMGILSGAAGAGPATNGGEFGANLGEMDGAEGAGKNFSEENFFMSSQKV